MQRRTLVCASLAVCLLALGTPAEADYQETFRFDSDSLRVGNLIGAIHVVSASGSDFEVVVDVRGSDARTGIIDFQAREGSRAQLLLRYPDENRYVYPELRGSTSIQRERGNRSWFQEVIAAVTGHGNIEVSHRGSGMELWADMTIRVPAGRNLELRHGVGDIDASAVDGDLLLDSQSGSISAERIEGDVSIDTGSGSVIVASVHGELEVDTGSGRVELRDVDGREVKIDTGSGSVQVDGVRSQRLIVDTGSGRVVAEGIETESAEIDTGSGSVRLDLIHMGDGDFDIDTGSGSITFNMPDGSSAAVVADTGSGGIDIDVPSVDMIRASDDHAEFRVGGGAARIRLDTGSGSIRVSTRG